MSVKPAHKGKHATYLYLCSAAEALMKKEIAKRSYVETGGMLIGYKSEGQVVVTHTTGPGPKAKHSLFNFQRDVDYCNEQLEFYFHRSNGVLTYIGEWHTHPMWFLSPSKQDDNEMFGIAETKSYKNPSPLLIIARKAKSGIERSAFHYRRGERFHLEIIGCGDVEIY